MRVPLRALPLSVLWLAGLWPLLLLAVALWSPLWAVRLAAGLELGLRTAAFWAGLAALVLAVLFPPFRAGVRLLGHLSLARLRADRGPLMHALGELRNFESAARHLDAGRAALGVSEPRTAVPHLLRAIELEPDNTAAHHLLGTAMLELHEPQRAEMPLKVVLQRDPGHAFGDALLLLGRCRMLQRDFAGAAELLTQHQREHGGNRRSHYWLGVCRRALGDAEGAREAFAVAARSPDKSRLTAQENWYRARAQVQLWTLRGTAADAEARP